MPKQKTTPQEASPVNEALRDALQRMLKKNADKWPQEAPDLRRWIEREKPTLENLREAFLATKRPDELAELLGSEKGLIDLSQRHAAAVEAAVQAFPQAYTNDHPPKIRAREDYRAEFRPEQLFSVLPFPAGKTPSKNPPPLLNPCFYPADISNRSFYPAYSIRYKPDENGEELKIKDTPQYKPGENGQAIELEQDELLPEPKTPQDAAELLLWTLINGEVVLLPAELFPKRNWLDLIAYAWLADRAEDLRALNIELRPIASVGGLHFTTFPRNMESASAMGGPISLADPVTVNGEDYANEPALVADAAGKTLKKAAEEGASLIVQPRGLEVVPKEWLAGPAQMTLELGLDPTNTPAFREYLVETATKTATLAQFTDMAPKLLGFMFACSPISGRGVKGTLKELAGWLIPDLKERRRPKDLPMVGTAFVAMKSLRVLEKKDNGVLHPYDLFSLDYDLSNKADAEVGWCINPWLAKRMQGGEGGGFFLLNMSRWLALPIRNPRIFPLALRLASYMDKARVNDIYKPERVQWIEADRLALECNTLPDGAAAYRTGKTDSQTAKQQLAKARANLEADLNTLQEAGLLGNWKKEKVYGKGFRLLPVAPDDYAEACRNAKATVEANRRKKKRADTAKS